MSDTSPHWYDEEAGPIVRLFAMTAGRARSSSGSETFDLMATIEANPTTQDGPTMSPEQHLILRICRPQPQTVTDIAAESKLPLGVVRVLLGDLLDAGYIQVSRPVPHQIPDTRILKEVIDGLRAL